MTDNNYYQQTGTSISEPVYMNLNAMSDLTDPWVILSDFDKTISLRDVTDTLLSKLGMPGCDELETEWLEGRIGSRECMGGQIALLDASKAELDACIDTIEIDPAFKAFVAAARAQGISVQIVSDGLDYAIHRILKRYGIDDIPVFANRLIQVAERSWQLQFPYARNNCRKASGNCKCSRVVAQQQRNRRVLFIGDGSSDFCAAGEVDFVFAKDSLVNHCRLKNIKYTQIDGFSDAITLLEKTVHARQYAAY
jgi:2,3-diketo-5-methylthio-1-phosphopentane phosphatase